MLNVREKMRRAQDEVRHGAHDQDLIEVPRRAMLDRRAEARIVEQPVEVGGGEIEE